MIITPQHVHDRNWMACPRCDGGKVFTAKDRKQGAICGTCNNDREIPRLRCTSKDGDAR